jgi:hypothetical protein
MCPTILFKISVGMYVLKVKMYMTYGVTMEIPWLYRTTSAVSKLLKV